MNTKHPLAKWIKANKWKISQAKLASESRCSQSHLSLILKGKRGVSMELARRLSAATGGAVRIEDFLMDPDEART